MLRRSVFAVLVVALFASPAFAQRAEVSGAVGYTFSEGVNFSAAPINGALYDRIDPAAGFSFNFTFGVYATEQAEVEFLYSRQTSNLEVSGAGPTFTGDMHTSTYHGNFVYNFGEHSTPLRPFAFIGLGATSYSDAVFPAQTVPGLTKFSWALGGGVKGWAGPNVGFKAMFRWIPTYIKSDPAGWWCGYWGCGTAFNYSYSNAFELSGGVVARF